MTTAAHPLFDTTILGRPIARPTPFLAPAKTAPRSRASRTPEMPASLWRRTLAEGEANRRHDRVAGSLFGLLGLLGIGGMALAARQVDALFAGHRFLDVITAFLR